MISMLTLGSKPFRTTAQPSLLAHRVVTGRFRRKLCEACHGLTAMALSCRHFVALWCLPRLASRDPRPEPSAPRYASHDEPRASCTPSLESRVRRPAPRVRSPAFRVANRDSAVAIPRAPEGRHVVATGVSTHESSCLGSGDQICLDLDGDGSVDEFFERFSVGSAEGWDQADGELALGINHGDTEGH